MNGRDWLCQQTAGYSELEADELNAITEFTLLWSFFEAQVLDRNANARMIIDTAQRWYMAGILKDSFLDTRTYFCCRYYREGMFTDHFNHLNLRQSDYPGLIKKLLQGECKEEWETAAAVLIIIYRFRNNLFHGEKWAYDLRGQRNNFEQANKALIVAMELQKRVLAAR